jgi:hypothetical protein
MRIPRERERERESLLGTTLNAGVQGVARWQTPINFEALGCDDQPVAAAQAWTTVEE